MRLLLAFKVFFQILFHREFAERTQLLLTSGAETATKAEPAKPEPQREVKPAKPARSDAITLLATLQREARFVDIVMEPLTDYTDAQIGAAARDVLADCGKVLDRLFAMKPVVDAPEDSELEAPAGFDAYRYRLTGNVAGEPPFKGRLVHHGWEAKRCELPQWSGSEAAMLVVAPVELEIRNDE